MIEIKGKHINGISLATHSVKAQFEHLLKYDADLKEVFIGTINIRLETPLFISHPDITTEPFKWSDDFPPEYFCLTRVEVSKAGENQFQKAWIYEAGFSPHRTDPYIVELLTSEMIFEPGDEFIIRILHQNSSEIKAVKI